MDPGRSRAVPGERRILNPTPAEYKLPRSTRRRCVVSSPDGGLGPGARSGEFNIAGAAPAIGAISDARGATQRAAVRSRSAYDALQQRARSSRGLTVVVKVPSALFALRGRNTPETVARAPAAEVHILLRDQNRILARLARRQHDQRKQRTAATAAGT